MPFESDIRKIIEDKHRTIYFDSLTGNDTYDLPYVLDSHGRNLLFVNNSDYELTLNLKGDDTCNGYSTNIIITEKGGWWNLVAGSTEWCGITNGLSTVYYIESESTDTGLSVDGTWDDVAGMELLNGVYGEFLLDAFGNQYCRILSHPTVIGIDFGLGKTSGNNAPDIKHNRPIQIKTAGQDLEYYLGERHIHNWEYISDGSTIYMKAKVISDELNADNHEMSGDTDCSMFIKARRTA